MFALAWFACFPVGAQTWPVATTWSAVMAAASAFTAPPPTCPCSHPKASSAAATTAV
jgi:hypothetical protein